VTRCVQARLLNAQTLGHAGRLTFLVILITSTVSCLPTRVRSSVKIGLVAPFEGTYRSIGYDAIYAVRLAIREANAAGGVGGYTIELVAYDDGGEPANAVRQAQKLVIDPEVVGVLGHFRTETTLSAMNVYVDSGMPLIVPGDALGGVELERTPVFSLALASEYAISVVQQYLDGGSCVALLDAERLPYWEDLRLCNDTEVNRERWVDAVLRSGAQAAFTNAEVVDAGELVGTLRARGWDGLLIGGPELALPDFAAIAGEAAEGVRFVTSWPLDCRCGEFISAYRDISHGTDPSPVAVLAYDATWLLLRSLEHSLALGGEPSRAGVWKALETSEWEGLSGVLAFDDTHHWRDGLLCVYEIHHGRPAEISCEHLHRDPVVE